MAPIVDGPYSIEVRNERRTALAITAATSSTPRRRHARTRAHAFPQVYFSCLDSCQRQLGERVGYSNMIESHDYIVYHLGGVASEESKSGAGRPAQNEEWFVYRWSR
eukprot:scaffold301436_cov36-Tisochrysis_lutea.AAC.2